VRVEELTLFLPLPLPTVFLACRSSLPPYRLLLPLRRRPDYVRVPRRGTAEGDQPEVLSGWARKVETTKFPKSNRDEKRRQRVFLSSSRPGSCGRRSTFSSSTASCTSRLLNERSRERVLREEKISCGQRLVKDPPALWSRRFHRSCGVDRLLSRRKHLSWSPSLSFLRPCEAYGESAQRYFPSFDRITSPSTPPHPLPQQLPAPPTPH
jgi:hypothetical protein